MAIYFDGASETYCPIDGLADGNDKDILNFTCDTATDTLRLPSIDRIRGGSTCFVINTSQVFMLGENGWREI